jgi:PDZ domain
MSRVLFSMPLIATALATGSIVSTVSAQPIESGIVLPAKLDAEGLSQMLVSIRVKEHTFWCSADSGNGRVLSLDITKALNAGLQPNATGTNAGVGPEIRRDERIRGVDVEIGPVVLRDLTIVLVPQPTVVPDIDCVFGLGLLSDYAIGFDYLTPSVRLIPSAQFRSGATAVSVPIAIDRVARPSTKVRLRIGGGTVEATLIVDTGASYYDVVLLKPFIDANRVTDRVGTIVPRFSDTPGMTIGAARAAAVSIGPFDVDGPVTALISTPSGGTYSTDGLLGAGFLRRFKVTFDYSRQQLWLEPNGRTRGPQLFDASGIDVRPTTHNEFAVVAVAADSAASAAGLRVGDLLKQVDGRPARQMTLGEIQDAFNRADKTCTVQVERDGRLQTAILHLRRRL